MIAIQLLSIFSTWGNEHKSNPKKRYSLRQRIDVHQWKQRYQRAEQNLTNDHQLSHSNRKKILRFVWDLQAEGITLPRLLKYLYILPKLAKCCSSLRDDTTVFK